MYAPGYSSELHRRSCCSVMGRDGCSPKSTEFPELSDSCVHIDLKRHKTVGDLKETLMILIGRGVFNLAAGKAQMQNVTSNNAHHLLLRLRGYVVPETQPVEVLRDNDELEVCLHRLNILNSRRRTSPEWNSGKPSNMCYQRHSASIRITSEASSESSLEETTGNTSVRLQKRSKSRASLCSTTTERSAGGSPSLPKSSPPRRRQFQQIRPGHVILGSSSSSESDTEEILLCKEQEKQCRGPPPLPLQEIRSQGRGRCLDVEPGVSKNANIQILDENQNEAANTAISDPPEEAFVPWDGPISPVLEGRWLRAQLLQLQNGYPQLSSEKLFRVVKVDVNASRVMLDVSCVVAANGKRHKCSQEKSQRGRWYNWSQVTGKKLCKDEAADLVANRSIGEGTTQKKCNQQSLLFSGEAEGNLRGKGSERDSVSLSNLAQSNGTNLPSCKYIPLRELRAANPSVGREGNANPPVPSYGSCEVPTESHRDLRLVAPKTGASNVHSPFTGVDQLKEDLFPWIVSVVVHTGGSLTQPELLLTSPPLGTLQLPGGENWVRENQGRRLFCRSAVQKPEGSCETERNLIVTAAVNAAVKTATERRVDDFMLLCECENVLPPTLMQRARRLLQQRFTQLRAAVRRQVDWYFSPSNWEKDSFLRDQSVNIRDALAADKGTVEGSNEASGIDSVALCAATAALAAASLGTRFEAMQKEPNKQEDTLCEELRVIPLKTLMEFPRMQTLTRNKHFVAFCVSSGGGLRHVSVAAGGAALLRKEEGASNC